MPSTDTNTSVELLLSLYRQRRKEIRHWFEQVRAEFQWWMGEEPYKRIHSVRARMKDVEDLETKIPRKNSARQTAERNLITKDNFFQEIEDLAGVRILVLYRHDIAIVDHFVYQSGLWRVSQAEAKYDSNRPKDGDWFHDHLGFEKETDFKQKSATNPSHPKRVLNPQENGYASIHYVLVPQHVPASSEHDLHYLKCELQVRTVHEEAWSEFSHEFGYPSAWVDPLAEQLIFRLSSLLHLAEDLVGDIRQHPAVARILRELYSRKDEPNHQAVSAITKLLEQFPYMARSPLLASFGLLAHPDQTSGKPISADTIVTIGYGQPSFRSVTREPLREIYQRTQIDWQKNDGTRKILKFSVETPSRGENKKRGEAPCGTSLRQ